MTYESTKMYESTKIFVISYVFVIFVSKAHGKQI